MLGKREVLGVRARDAGVGQGVADEVDDVGLGSIYPLLERFWALTVVFEIQHALGLAVVLGDEPMHGVVERVHDNKGFCVLGRLVVGDGERCGYCR